MGALHIFASTKYVSHIDYLTPILVDLSQPDLTKTTLSNTKTTLTLKDDTVIVTDSATTEDIEEYRLKLKQYLKDKNAVKTTKRFLHNIAWGQCSHILRTKLKDDDALKKIETDGDVVELLKKIRGVCRQMTSNASIYDSIEEAKKRYYGYR